jgi:hypothetical protein
MSELNSIIEAVQPSTLADEFADALFQRERATWSYRDEVVQYASENGFNGDVLRAKRAVRADMLWLYELLEDIDVDLLADDINKRLLEVVSLRDSPNFDGTVASLIEGMSLLDNDHVRERLGDELFEFLFRYMNGEVIDGMSVQFGARNFKRIRLIELCMKYSEKFRGLELVKDLEDQEVDEVSLLLISLLSLSVRPDVVLSNTAEKVMAADVYVLQRFERALIKLLNDQGSEDASVRGKFEDLGKLFVQLGEGVLARLEG